MLNPFKVRLYVVLVMLAGTACQDTVSLQDDLISYRNDLMKEARSNIRGDDYPCLEKAYQQLISKADQYLDEPCPSVMLKNKVPPSGNKHDYMSIGPYWWPDSTKKGGLPYIRKDGEVNPEYHNADTDHGAFKRFLDMIETLSMGYYFSGENKYAEKAAICMRVWFLDEETRMNPHLRFGQAIPGLNMGRFIGIIETRYLGKVCDWATILAKSESWTEEDQNQLSQWMEKYMNWLMYSDFGIEEANWPNNHGTWFDVQVVSLAQFLGKHQLAAELLEEVKTRRLDKQLTPDGSQPHELERTKSLSYSLMNLRGYYLLAHMAQKEEVDLWNYQTIDNPGIKGATDFLVRNALMKDWSYNQIGGLSELKDELVELLFWASLVYETNEYESYIKTIRDQKCDDWRILLWNGYNYY